jgi:hypothetical protein
LPALDADPGTDEAAADGQTEPDRAGAASTLRTVRLAGVQCGEQREELLITARRPAVMHSLWSLFMVSL